MSVCHPDEFSKFWPLENYFKKKRRRQWRTGRAATLQRCPTAGREKTCVETARDPQVHCSRLSDLLLWCRVPLLACRLQSSREDLVVFKIASAEPTRCKSHPLNSENSVSTALTPAMGYYELALWSATFHNWVLDRKALISLTFATLAAKIEQTLTVTTVERGVLRHHESHSRCSYGWQRSCLCLSCTGKLPAGCACEPVLVMLHHCRCCGSTWEWHGQAQIDGRGRKPGDR